MARRIAAMVAPAVVAAAAALALASSGTAASHGSPIRVAPSAGEPGTTFVVSFAAPDPTGIRGSTRLRITLSATNAQAGAGCLAGVDATAPRALRRGQRLRVRLDPLLHGGRWCPGTYRGTILEVQTAVCPQGKPCPTYVLVKRRIGPFALQVRPSGDRAPPSFNGLERAFACTPGPQRPGQTTPYTLTWAAAQDDITPAAEIVYDVYFSTAPGGESLSRPTWTTAPGITSFRTPGLPSHGVAYFVVRARDAAGNEDGNTVEQKGLDPCV
jgi:hypothetical protein